MRPPPTAIQHRKDNVSAAARITQDDMTRATKAVAAGKLERARIVFDLQNQRIEIIVGDPLPSPIDDEGKWSDDNV